MKKIFCQKLLALICCWAILLGFIPGIPGLEVEASAAEITGLDNDNVGLDGDSGWEVIDGTTIRGTVAGTGENKSGCEGDSRTTQKISLSIKNNTATEKNLKFKCVALFDDPANGSVAIDGSTVTDTSSPQQEYTYEKKIGGNGGISISLTSGKGEGMKSTLTISEIALNDIGQKNSVTFLVNPAVSYDVAGTTITDQTTMPIEVDASEGISVTAPETYTVEDEAGNVTTMMLLGWKNYGNGKTVEGGAKHEMTSLGDGIAAATIKPANGIKVIPVYIKQQEAVFRVGSSSYYTWEDAFHAANGSGTVVLLRNYTLPATLEENGLPETNVGTYVRADTKNTADTADDELQYRVPAGVTFVAPLSADHTTVAGQTDAYPYANYDANGWNGNRIGDSVYNKGTIYVTLTISKEITVNVEGIFSIGSQIETIIPMGGFPVGKHSNVHNKGTISVKDGGVLSACGFIYDESTEQTGTVTAESGAKVYEVFSIADFRGATYVALAAGKNANMNSAAAKVITFPDAPAVFPTQQYGPRNIQCEFTINKGASLFGYVGLYGSDAVQKDTIQLVGETEGLILLTGADSHVTRTYQKDIAPATYSAMGKSTLTLSGDAKFGSIALNVSIDIKVTTISATVTSSSYTFYIGYNYDVVLEKGNFTIDKSIALLPGASITVGEEATLTIETSGSLSVLTALDNSQFKIGFDKAFASWESPAIYPGVDTIKSMDGENGSANFFVDGGLIIKGAFGGIIQTNTSDDTNRGDSNYVDTVNASALSTTTYVGANGKGSIVGLKNYWYTGRSVHTLPAQVYDAATGQLVNLVQGYKYYSMPVKNIYDSYTQKTYDYTQTQDYTSTKDVKVDVNAKMDGSWWNYAVKVHMMVMNKETNTLEEKNTITMRFARNANVTGMGFFSDNTYQTAVNTIENGNDLYCTRIEASIQRATGTSWQYYPTFRSAVQDTNSYAAEETTNTVRYDTVRVEAELNLSTTVVVDRTIGLDLNQRTLSRVGGAALTLEDGVTLYGGDASSNGFQGPTGSVTVSGGTVSAVARVDGKDYVSYTADSASAATKTYSFHRFAITPIACRFYLNDIKNHAHLEVKAAIQGDDTAIAAVKDLCFLIDRTENWYGSVPAFSGGDEEADGNKTVSYIALTYGGTEETDYTDSHTITAKAAFDAEKKQLIESDGSHSISLYEVLRQYASSTEIDAARVSAFIGKLT